MTQTIKRTLSLVLALIMALSCMSVGAWAVPLASAENAVASVTSGSDTSYYATIEEAVAAWGPGKTLTLLEDVAITSTIYKEYSVGQSNYILQLGDKRITANGCNAIEFKAVSGSIHGNNGLIVYANTNGGITVDSGKYAFYMTDAGATDADKGHRARLEVHGGTYDGGYFVKTDNGYNNWGYPITNKYNTARVYLYDNNNQKLVVDSEIDMMRGHIEFRGGTYNGKIKDYVNGGTQYLILGVGSRFKFLPSGGNDLVGKSSNCVSIDGSGNDVFIYYDGEYYKVLDAIPSSEAEVPFNATEIGFLTYSSNNKWGVNSTYNAYNSVKYTNPISYHEADTAISIHNEIILSENVSSSQDRTLSSGTTLTIDASAKNAEYSGTVTLSHKDAKFAVKGTFNGNVVCGVTGMLVGEPTVADGFTIYKLEIDPETAPVKVIGANETASGYYLRIDDALTAAQTDETVKVVTDGVTYTSYVSPKNGNNASLSLGSNTVSYASYAVYSSSSSYSMTVLDGQFKSSSTYSSNGTVQITNGYATIKGGYFENMGAGNVICVSNGTLNILGGTFTGNISKSGGTLTITGGTFDHDPSEYVPEGYFAKNNGDGTWIVLECIAKIGTTGYESLEAAVEAAEDGETITLQKNVTLDSRIDVEKSITIDLGGKTVTPTMTCANGSAFNVKSGTVAIQNGTIDGRSVQEGVNGSAITVNNGICLVTVRDGATLNLNDAGLTMLINSKNGSCVYPFAGGKVNISAGSFKNETTEDYQWKSGFKGLTVNQANVATSLVTITGGKFYGNNPASGDDHGATFVPSAYESKLLTEGVFAGWYEVTQKTGIIAIDEDGNDAGESVAAVIKNVMSDATSSASEATFVEAQTVAGIENVQSIKADDSEAVTDTTSSITVKTVEVTTSTSTSTETQTAYAVTKGEATTIATASIEQASVKNDAQTTDPADFVKVPEVVAGAVAQQGVTISDGDTVTTVIKLTKADTPHETAGYKFNPQAVVTVTHNNAATETTYTVPNEELTGVWNVTVTPTGEASNYAKVTHTPEDSNGNPATTGATTAIVKVEDGKATLGVTSFSYFKGEYVPDNFVAAVEINGTDTFYETFDAAAAVAIASNEADAKTVTLLKPLNIVDYKLADGYVLKVDTDGKQGTNTFVVNAANTTANKVYYIDATTDGSVKTFVSRELGTLSTTGGDVTMIYENPTNKAFTTIDSGVNAGKYANEISFIKSGLTVADDGTYQYVLLPVSVSLAEATATGSFKGIDIALSSTEKYEVAGFVPAAGVVAEDELAVIALLPEDSNTDFAFGQDLGALIVKVKSGATFTAATDTITLNGFFAYDEQLQSAAQNYTLNYTVPIGYKVTVNAVMDDDLVNPEAILSSFTIGDNGWYKYQTNNSVSDTSIVAADKDVTFASVTENYYANGNSAIPITWVFADGMGSKYQYKSIASDGNKAAVTAPTATADATFKALTSDATVNVHFEAKEFTISFMGNKPTTGDGGNGYPITASTDVIFNSGAEMTTQTVKYNVQTNLNRSGEATLNTVTLTGWALDGWTQNLAANYESTGDAVIDDGGSFTLYTSATTVAEGLQKVYAKWSPEAYEIYAKYNTSTTNDWAAEHAFDDLEDSAYIGYAKLPFVGQNATTDKTVTSASEIAAYSTANYKYTVQLKDENDTLINAPEAVTVDTDGKVTISSTKLYGTIAPGSKIYVYVLTQINATVKAYPLSNNVVLVTATNAAGKELKYYGERMLVDARYTDTTQVMLVDYSMGGYTGGLTGVETAISNSENFSANAYVENYQRDSARTAITTTADIAAGNYNVNGSSDGKVDIVDITLVYNAYKGTYSYAANPAKGGRLSASVTQYLLSDVTFTKGTAPTYDASAPVNAWSEDTNAQLINMLDVKEEYKQAYTTNGN